MIICRILPLTTGLWVLAGCTAEPPTPARHLVDVQGTVTRDGEPVPRTIVLFVPVQEGGSRAKGITDQRGHFRLIHESDAPGAEVGEYRVVLQTLHLRPAAADGEPVEAAYGDPQTTPFQARVSPQEATFHFKLNRPDGT